MYAHEPHRMRRVSRLVGVTMILGMTVVSLAPICASPAQAARARRSTTGSVPIPAWTAYIANLDDNTVTPINTATNTAGTPIPVGRAPVGIAITPNGDTAYVTNLNDGTVTPINTATNTAGTPIPVGILPFGIAITPNGATAYVAHEGNGTVTPIDTATNTVGAPIPVGINLTFIAITPNGSTAYVTDSSKNTVTPINTAIDVPGAPIPVGENPSGIAVTPNGATLYLTNGGVVTPISTATNVLGAPIKLGHRAGPFGMAIAPDGATDYVANLSDNTVSPIDTATNIAGNRIPVGEAPYGVAITPDGSTAYVTNSLGDTVTPINTATNTAGNPIAVGASPHLIAIVPDQAPVANLSVTPGKLGQPTEFDASASTVAFGTITSYAWNFGDGSTATTSVPTTTHTYGVPGPYTASVTETDSAGTSTTQVFTGQTMSNNGGPSAVASRSFTVVPTLCGAGLNAHVLTATYHAGNFIGLFCVNAKGIGTYTQGGVSGWGSVAVRNGTITILALGQNLFLLGRTKGTTRSEFIELAPGPIKHGTFTLT